MFKDQFKILMIITFGLFLMSPWAKISSQTLDIDIEEVMGVNGVKMGKTNSIVQDKQGFMWFANQTYNSIIRYDGHSMKEFRHNPDDLNSPGGTNPEWLFVDDDGILWIGYSGQGLDRYDPYSNSFTHFKHDPENPNSLSNNFVHTINMDHTGALWIGTSGGLNKFDPKTHNFEHFIHDPNDESSLSHNAVRSLYEDSSGTLWVGTGFFWIPDEKGGLNKFDRQSGKFTRFLHDPNDPTSLIGNKVRSIFEDSQGTLWIGTNKDGLHSMNRETGTFIRHLNDPSNPSKLSRSPVDSRINTITFIVEDSEKNLWIGSAYNGINKYNLETKSLVHFGKESIYNSTQINFSSWSACTTDDGLVWLGTQTTQKLYKIDLLVNKINFVEVMGLNDYLEDSPSVYWLATDQGLIKHNLETLIVKKYLHDPDNTNSLSNNLIRSITKDKDGLLWILTIDGINCLDPKNDSVRRFLFYPNAPLVERNINTNKLYEDGFNNLWIGTENDGLWRFNRTEERFTHYKYDPKDTSTLGLSAITSIFSDKQNNIWVGSYGNGVVCRFNDEEETLKRFLSGKTVFDLYLDDYGILWAGANTNLYKFETETDSFVPSNFGLRSNIIIAEEENLLWIYNHLGLFRYNHKIGSTIHYGKKNNVIGITGGSGIARNLSNGNIVFTNPAGYYSFDPEKLITISDSTKLFMTDFRIRNEPLANEKEQSNTIYGIDEIELKHDENVFSMSFSGIDYRNNENNKFNYILKDYDEDWHRGESGTEISYYKVPPGDYKFLIETTNGSSGLISQKVLSINILPPWYATWWSYLLYTLGTIAIIYNAYNYNKRRLLAKERAKSQLKELKHAKEIEKAYSELKLTQKQLIQSEKMASLGELTAGIAHEIQNPLNFVNNFSELSVELLEEVNEELRKGDMEEVNAILLDVNQNLKKINSHGKRADGIIKGMLEHSRSSSGERIPTDVNQLAEEYANIAYHGIKAKDKTFKVHLKKDFDKNIGKISIIPQDIGRVLLNLINNAFHTVSEHSREIKSDYQPQVTISTKNINDKVQIVVKDNGKGISETIKDKIFQPFFTTKPTGQGTGLGLSLSYDIVKAHDGEIELISEEGKGTTFVVSLPKHIKP